MRADLCGAAVLVDERYDVFIGSTHKEGADDAARQAEVESGSDFLIFK